MADFSTTDKIPDLINKKKSLTFSCKHNDKVIKIYIGNRSIDKITLWSNILSTAYIGNTPISSPVSYTHSCYLYLNKIYNETKKSYINPDVSGFTVNGNLYGKTISGGIALVHTGSAKAAWFVVLEADENNVLPVIDSKYFIDCQTFDYNNKKYLRIAPNYLTTMPEGISDANQSYQLTVTQNKVAYNIYSTWCYVNFNDSGNMQGVSTIGFDYKIEKSKVTTPSTTRTSKNLVISGVVTHCHDYIGSGSEGTGFRLVILHNRHPACIYFNDTPSKTETFSLGININGESSASTSPDPFKYSDNVTISNL